MYRIDVPEKVEHIIDTLTAAGHEAYAVGGCVRDALLGREPADWDITTSASPYEVKALFSRTIDTGIQHGTVTVMLGKEGFDVTTYRWMESMRIAVIPRKCSLPRVCWRI